MKYTTWSFGVVRVTPKGTGVVAHAWSVAVRLLADRTGLTAELSQARSPGPGSPRSMIGAGLVEWQ